MGSSERDLVSRLLRQSILTLCRETLEYRNQLEIDGIVCLTSDDEKQHVIKIHEVFRTRPGAQSISTPADVLNNTAVPAVDQPITVKQEVLPGRPMRESPNTFRTSDGEINNIPLKAAISRKDVHSSHRDENPTYNETNDRGNFLSSERQAEIDLNKTYPPIEQSLNTEHVHIQGHNHSDKTKSEEVIHPSSLTAVDYKSLGLDELRFSAAQNIPCKKCNSILDNATLFQTHNMSAHNHFTCLICLQTFTSRNNMKRHIRLHTGIKPYSCNKCSESFSRNDDFKRHLLKHAFQKPFRCAVCKSGYSDRTTVKSHMAKEHNTATFHICPQCGETYIDVHSFQQHKKSHPEFQDYRCSICSFTGSNALMYNKHMLTHGPSKNYRCLHCEITYPDPFVYTSHMKKHRGDDLVQSYECCFCDTVLQSFEQFQRHEHTHIHSKQHECRVCGKVFRYPSNLREHMLTHVPKAELLASANSPSLVRISGLGKTGQVPTVVLEKNMAIKSEELHVHMEVEENNNSVELDKEIDDEDMERSPSIDNVSGSSEYWCTECNHGFGTETELQNHIIYRHEGRNEDICHLDVKEEPKSPVTEAKNPSPESTQGKSQNKNFYMESTSSFSGHISSAYTKSIQGEQKISQSRRSLSPYRKPLAGAPLVFKKENIQYDKDSVEDDDNHNQPGAITRQSDSDQSPLNLSKPELNTVKDAMRQVQNIQTRFGIKPLAYKSLLTSNGRDKPSMADQDIWVERSRSWPSSHSAIWAKDSEGEREGSQQIAVNMTKMRMQRDQQFYDTPNNAASSFNNKDSDITDAAEPIKEKSNADNEDDVANDETHNKYSKTSVLGMDTEFSDSPNRTPTSLNLKIRNPGFERVVTPEVLFKTKAPFTCEVCQETFADFETFHEHGVKVHRRYICSYCGKVFTSRPNRERHIRYHTGEKPYKCELCAASFLRGDDLKYHRTTKHADVKPFTCGACQTSFSLPKDLEKHLRMYPNHKL